METMKFSFARIPLIYFGAGSVSLLPKAIGQFGNTCLIVTGASSLRTSGRLERIHALLREAGIHYEIISVSGEPTPNAVDAAVIEFRSKGIGAVVAIGGGSAIDAGKAISAMLPSGDSVIDYLEGIGTKQHPGEKVPFIAVPTTGGTGSEATKNAVLSKSGKGGFKRSLRHDNFVPNVALIDPELAMGVPFEVTAATGLDALTQLIEAYVSTAANPMADALALSGLEKIKQSFIPLCTGAGDELVHRTSMAYAALMSGIALANAGLGVVHGIAPALGSIFGLTHGVACGTLLGASVKVTVQKLMERGEESHLQKFARIGALFTGCDVRETSRACERLVFLLEEWVELLKMPRLSKFGIRESDFDEILSQSSNKNNPASLSKDEMRCILAQRL
ncbi:MAG: iron-containing alcohol dehydrogenase [Spirochaetes bacterium]|nr:iron-containing alcohol dehydrogenase [Spirochaetota bacterium]